MIEMDSQTGGARSDEDAGAPPEPHPGQGETGGQSQATVPEEDDPAIEETEQQPT